MPTVFRIVPAILLVAVVSQAQLHLPNEHMERSLLAKTSLQDVSLDESVDGNNGVAPRIVGGQDALPEEFPYFVHGNGCGGTLIWKDVVLTAAHCRSAWTGKALVGAYRRNQEIGGAEYIPIRRRLMHPKWGGMETLEYDIMLVFLEEIPSKNLSDSKVRLARVKPRKNEIVTTIGLGLLQESGGSPSLLQKVNLTYVSATECAKTYYPASLFDGDEVIDPNSMICAIGDNKDSCYGDSGGPLLNKKGRQVGVVSWGIGCSNNDFAGVYSYVPAAVDWIDQQICKLSRSPPIKKCCIIAHGAKQRSMLEKCSLYSQPRGACSDTNLSFGIDATTGKDCVLLGENRYMF